jgi:hypothetical protein
MKTVQLFICIAGLLFAASCAPSKKTSVKNTSDIKELRFINEYVVPNALQFKGTTIGGLSGIDRNVRDDLYYIISDDRSDKSPAHFYTAKIFINENGIDSVKFIDVIPLLD